MVQRYGLRFLAIVPLLTLAWGGAQVARASVPAASTAAVAISGFKFSPAKLTIRTGTTVTWTNSDTAPHTATSDSNAWTTSQLQQGQSGKVTFNHAGTFAYHCNVHPNMKALIVVQGAPAPIKVQAKEVKNHYVFGPVMQKIKIGQTIVWKNTTDAPHTVTSTSASWKYNQKLPVGASLRFTFMKAGTFHYKCLYHPGMVGTVVVTK